MRVLAIQHVPFEGVGFIGEWATEREHILAIAQAPTERYPEPGEYDFLIVMGGPMDADDEVTSPWLLIEKHFVAEAIADGKPVLGICLGAQILVDVLGGRVRRNAEREIGWYPVHLTEAGSVAPLFAHWPDPVVVGHWHCDTFDMPMSLQPVLGSVATANQAFVFDGRVVGLQFHLEWDEAALRTLVDACGEELAERTSFVMSAPEFVDETPDRIPACRELLFGLLDAMVAIGPRAAREVVR